MTLNLKYERERAGYTIQQVADKLNIRKQYIINLEEGNYDTMPGDVYIQGYMKMYHGFLGITPSLPATQELDRNKMPESKYSISNKYKKIISALSLSLLCVISVIYNI